MQPPWLQRLEDHLDAELEGGSPDSPFRPTVLHWATANGRPVNPVQLLARLEANRIGGRGGSRRYPWNFPIAGWLPLEDRIRWRPGESEAAEREAEDHGRRLWLPIVLTDHVEWLHELAHGHDDRLRARAGRLLGASTPTLEDDVARHVQGADPWGDTFLLWTFARRPRALTLVRGLVSAVASRYAARAGRANGTVLGRSFPFFETAMPSATAHLAAAAARIGDGTEVVADAVKWLQAERRPDGGWGDPRQPSDVLTTLAVAELLGSLDPGFEPAEVVDVLGNLAASRNGRPVLIGPEWPWLAAELLSFSAWSALPFRERFRWPHVPDWMMDRRTDVPLLEAYFAFARLFETLPGLAEAPVEVAFLDIAGFGHWNTAHGQDAGDELLACLTALLRSLPESRTIRDGGDEFLVVGAPQAEGLEERMRRLSARWIQASRSFSPDLPVVPLRTAVMTTRADSLREAREHLGQWIGVLKADFPEPPPEGVVRRFPEYRSRRDGGAPGGTTQRVRSMP